MSATAGAVAAGDPQTAEAGAEALRAGGTAIDAVCAAAFAAFVVEPPLCSPAGGGALLFGDPRHGFHVLDFFAAAPGLGLARLPQLDFHVVDVDFGPTVQQFHVGRGAAAVPGALLGLLDAHRRGGRLPLADVLAPAIGYGRDGYVLAPAVRFIVDILRPIVQLTPPVRAIFGAEHGIPPAGVRLRNPALADFLEQLATDSEALVRGPVADALIDHFGPAQGGAITRRDLDAYHVIVREPLRVEAGAHTLLTNPPPSSGGALVGLGLHLARDFVPIDATTSTAAYVCEVADVLRALSDARAGGYDERIREPDAARRLFEPETIEAWRRIHQRIRAERSLGGTTHISVLDVEGHAASLTMSNGEGCGHAIEELGIVVNNFLGEQDINPGGFHLWPPGQRMTTMMAPSVVVRDGRPVLVLGSGGSNRIRSAILQVLLHVIDNDWPLARAVQAPRLHVEGDHLWFEVTGLAEGAEAVLRRRWTESTRFDHHSMFFGGVHAVGYDGDALVGAGDARRGGTVAIVRQSSSTNSKNRA